MPRYFGANRDITHAEVRDALRAQGWKVRDTADAKRFVDLVAYHPSMRTVGVFLIEVKAPKKANRKSAKTEAQEDLAADGWPIVLLTDAASALAWHRQVIADFVRRP